ncbi:MAG: amidohydrolase [Deltaproteobacteria bacterium]|nr:amidohydrolase [Deltaproteobacteria bacterium]
MPADIIITNGIVVTVNPHFDIIKNGEVRIKDGRITSVGPVGMDAGHHPEAQVIDAGGGIIMPGLINTHTHLPMSLFRGLADDLMLSDWLNKHIFPAESKHINEHTVRIASLLSCAEMLLSGTTTCCDGYFFESGVAAAVRESGMRAVLGQGVIDFPAPGAPDPARNIDIAREFLAAVKDTSPLIHPSVFCHSPYTCSGKTLCAAKALANEFGVRFQIHVAETKGEADMIEGAGGLSPIAYLDRLGILDENTIAVHCIWVDDVDIEILADKGVCVSHNPESNMKLASGAAPVAAMLDAGILAGIGTDGCASNNDLDMFSEMDMAAKLAKVFSMDTIVLDAQTVLTAATMGGASVAGLSEITGSIEKGKAADIIIVNTAKPHLTPMYDPVSHLVYAARGSDVDTVMVNGRILVKDGALVYMDVEKIMDGVRKVAGEVMRG